MAVKYHRATGHPVPDGHPHGVDKFEVDEAIRPVTSAQLPALRTHWWLAAWERDGHDPGDEDRSGQ